MLLIFSINSLFSQMWNGESKPVLDKAVWESFKNGKVFVVLNDNGTSSVDKQIIETVKKCWIFNQYEFISKTKMDSLKISQTSFFITIIDSPQENFGHNIYLSIVYFEHNERNYLAKTNFYYTNNYLKTPLLLYLNHVQWYGNLALSGSLKPKTMMNHLISLSYPSNKENMSPFKSKPLYILDYYLNKKIKNIADIKKKYDGEVYIVTEKELEKIVEKNENINIFICDTGYMRGMKNKPGETKYASAVGFSFSYVYDLKSGELLYRKRLQLSSAVPPGIVAFNLKRLNKNKIKIQGIF